MPSWLCATMSQSWRLVRSQNSIASRMLLARPASVSGWNSHSDSTSVRSACDRMHRVVVDVVGVEAEQEVRHQRVVVGAMAIVLAAASSLTRRPAARPLIVALSFGALISM